MLVRIIIGIVIFLGGVYCGRYTAFKLVVKAALSNPEGLKQTIDKINQLGKDVQDK